MDSSHGDETGQGGCVSARKDVGAVVIGRNEGLRLDRCLSVLVRDDFPILYVDSGSTDGSVGRVSSFGVRTIVLDAVTPFSAARARNEGARALCNEYPELSYLQFIDGDCELADGWIATARQYLESNPHYAIACGRIRELYADRSLYNLLCDIEWDTPVGDAAACGGIFLVRRTAFEQAEGFNPTIVAGEEPELCYRLRRLGYGIRRLDREMALHDAAMTRFSQWLTRAKRSGHAYAQAFFMHRADHEGFGFMQSLKIWVWSVFFPLLVASVAIAVHPGFLWLLVAYPLRLLRISARRYRALPSLKRSVVYGVFTLMAPWPQLAGQLLYIRRRFRSEAVRIIEHKHGAGASSNHEPYRPE
mgnify:FL=1